VKRHHHGEGELEEVVVESAEELGPEEGRESTLAQKRKLGAALSLLGNGLRPAARMHAHRTRKAGFGDPGRHSGSLWTAREKRKML
jgi:hypothetical protein